MRKIFVLLFLLFSFCSEASIIQKGSVSVTGIMYQSTPEAGGQPRILTMGDSNTAGQGGFPERLCAYRCDLQDTVGVGVYDMVGDFQSPSSDPTYDVDNSGVGGETTAQIEARVADDLDTYLLPCVSGDVIVLNGGTNDGLLDTQGERDAARDNIEDMIDLVESFNTTNGCNVKIIVATIIPVKTGSSIALADVASYNEEVKTMVEGRQTTNSNLYISDVYTAFVSDTTGLCSGDYDNNCMYAYDAEHANLTGYTVMGTVIGNAITNCAGETTCTAP